MPPKHRLTLLISLLWVAAGAAAQERPQTDVEPQAEPTAVVPARSPAAAAAWDAALGLTGSWRPQYPGSPRTVLKTSPAFYLRYGRFTATNASSLAPRRSEDVARGLGVELLERDGVRASLSLRYDAGRSEHSNPAYQGLGKIPHTLRARAAMSWQINGPWRFGASWSPDALGRGDGALGDVSLAWDRRLTPDTLFTLASSLALANQRYMQIYYGVNAMQAQRSIYPEYEARAGLRDVGISANLRHDFGHEWTVLGSAGATKLLGSAAGSPITRQSRGHSVSGAVARQF